MRLGQILREIFVPSGSRYERHLSDLRDRENRVKRCLQILEDTSMISIQRASEEAARFDDNRT